MKCMNIGMVVGKLYFLVKNIDYTSDTRVLLAIMGQRLLEDSFRCRVGLRSTINSRDNVIDWVAGYGYFQLLLLAGSKVRGGKKWTRVIPAQSKPKSLLAPLPFAIHPVLVELTPSDLPIILLSCSGLALSCIITSGERKSASSLAELIDGV